MYWFTMFYYFANFLKLTFISIMLGGIVYVLGFDEFSENDFMYVTTAISSGHPYESFNFVQGPFTYYFWNTVSNFLPDENLYTNLRIITAILVGIAISIPALFFFSDNSNRAIFILLSLGSSYILEIGWEIGNYSLTLVLLSSGVTFILSKKKLGIIFGAICIGLAASAKISFVLFLIPGFAAVMILRGWAGKFEAIFLFSAGTLFGLLPVLFYAIQNLENFLFHNLYFHSKITMLYREFTIKDSAISIIKGTFLWVYSEITIIAIVAILAVLAQISVRTFFSSRNTINFTIVILFFAFAIITAWSPMIVFSQYLAPASFFIVWILVITFSLLLDNQRKYLFKVIMYVSICVFSLNLAKSIEAIVTSGDRINLVKKHELISTHLDDVLASSSCQPNVTTMSGSFLAGTRAKPTIGSHSGPFWARLLPLVSQRMIQNPALSLQESLLLPEIAIKEGRANFALTGYYPNNYPNKFEEKIISAAESLDFDRVFLGSFNNKDIVLFKRPAC